VLRKNSNPLPWNVSLAGFGHDVDDAAVVVAVLGIEVFVSRRNSSIESRFGTTLVPPFMRSCTSLPLT